MCGYLWRVVCCCETFLECLFVCLCNMYLLECVYCCVKTCRERNRADCRWFFSCCLIDYGETEDLYRSPSVRHGSAGTSEDEFQSPSLFTSVSRHPALATSTPRRKRLASEQDNCAAVKDVAVKRPHCEDLYAALTSAKVLPSHRASQPRELFRGPKC